MKIQSTLFTLIAILVTFLSSHEAAKANEGLNATYVLESLKFVHTVNIKGTEDKITGTFSSEEYGDGAKEKISFTGKISGGKLIVKLSKEAQLCALAEKNDNGFYTWPLSGEHETLFIPIHSRDEDGKDVTAKMPLELVR